MRKINYRVKGADGIEFHTTSYQKATEKGNRIEETYFTIVDERTEEQKEWMKINAQKFQKTLKTKKG